VEKVRIRPRSVGANSGMSTVLKTLDITTNRGVGPIGEAGQSLGKLNTLLVPRDSRC